MAQDSDIQKAKEPSISYDKKLTYADYLNFDFEYMVELIKGQLYKMTPAPSSRHQEISVSLTRLFGSYFLGKSCVLYHAPFDVILPIANEKRKTSTTVVQPDLCVICDLDKIDEAGCLGPPDLIIEILSPSTQKKDLTQKYAIYEETGVKEYWVIYPSAKMLHLYILEDGKYGKPEIFDDQDVVSPLLFPELKVNLLDVFKDIK